MMELCKGAVFFSGESIVTQVDNIVRRVKMYPENHQYILYRSCCRVIGYILWPSWQYIEAHY